MSTRILRRAPLVTAISSLLAGPALAALVFRGTVEGEELDLSKAKQGPETEAVKHFVETGENQYRLNWDEEAIKKGGETFLTMCSGCHGHHAEGKLGPALADDYWTYPKNKTDKGLFETTFGGASAMMGPMYKQLSIDEMLMVVSWIRAIYRGPVENADWLTEEQKKTFKPRPFSDEGAAKDTAPTAKLPAEK